MGSSLVRGFSVGPVGALLRTAIYLTSTCLSVFDTVTDWQVALRYQARGFNHPLLKTDIHWVRAWYLFAAIGTVLTALTFANETIWVYGTWRATKMCCCKRKRGSYDVGEDESKQESENGETIEIKESRVDTNVAGNDSKKQEKPEKQYVETGEENIEMKERKINNYIASNEQQKQEKVEKSTIVEADDADVSDACICCHRFGWNFTTRAETLGALSIFFQDAPMMIMAFLYIKSQTTCKQPEMMDLSEDVLFVGLSALASTAALTFKVARSIWRFSISLGYRIKSQLKDATCRPEGAFGRCVCFFLPEKGDAVYPQDKCAQCCIVPFYVSIAFDVVLAVVFVAFTSVILHTYSSLRHANFDDSLAIYRFRIGEPDIRLINISNNIIPASNGTFVSFEKIVDDEFVTYCLSEFKYREEDLDIFFNTVEVQALSTEGEFCATKAGENTTDRSSFSDCTFDYTYGQPGFILYYASTDRDTGEINQFVRECSAINRGVYFAGPELDRSIQVNRTIDRTRFPKSREDLLILYVHIAPPNLTVLFDIPVADLVAGGLDKTYLRSFQHPVSGANLTYLIRIRHIIFEDQLKYSVREVSEVTDSGCICDLSRFFSGFKQFHENATLVYGYYDAQNQNYQLLLNCSQVPLERLVPQLDASLRVDCEC